MDEMWNTVINYLTQNGLTLTFKIIAALAIFLIGRIVAKGITNLCIKGMEKAKADPTLINFLRGIIHTALIVFVVIAALSQLLENITTQFAAVLAAAGLAVGFALQGSLSNFAAGIILIVLKPFKTGDFVDISGIKGTVLEIQIFNTILNSPDNVRIFVPNSQITGGNIMNYSFNANRRVDLIMGVSYDDDLKLAKQVILDTLKADSRVLETPAPTVAVSELADSSVNLVVRPWVKSTDYWDVFFDTTEKIKQALEANGLSIPYPQQDIHVFKDLGANISQ